MFRTIITICLAMMLAACSSGKRDQDAEKKGGDSAEVVVQDEVKPTHDLPPGEGAFVRNGNKFMPIESGERAFLLPTNAERGFGFGFPAGTVVPKNTREFTIQSSQMHPDMLQITRYQGVAAQTDSWLDDVSHANVAWLADEHVPARIEVLQRSSGTVDIHLEDDLEPGFYVIHDDMMMRGRRHEDVSVYYPFVVNNGKTDLWSHQAESCFKALLDEYGVLMPLSAPEDIKAVMRCAQIQRISWKAARDDEAKIRTSKLRLIWLSRLAFPDNPEIATMLRLQMSENGEDLAHDLWQIAQSDNLQMLNQLYNEALEKKPFTPFYLHQIVADNMGSSDVSSISALMWMVFSTAKAADNPQIQALFRKMVEDDDYQSDLIALIGGIYWRKMMDLASSQRGSSSFVQKLKTNVNERFVSFASSIQGNKTRDTVYLGPLIFEGVPDEEISAWKATLMDKKRDVEKCITSNSMQDSATLILTQPLNGSIIGSEKPGTLRDPIDSQRSRPVISAESVSCILKIFSALPFNPSLDDDQSIRMAITIVKN